MKSIKHLLYGTALVAAIGLFLLGCGTATTTTATTSHTGGTAPVTETTAPTRTADTTPPSLTDEDEVPSVPVEGGSVPLVVGATPVPHAEILKAAKPLLAARGFKLEIIEFTDYIQPNAALSAGDLDANFFQHQPYLDDYNAKNGSYLTGLAAIHFEPLNLYSGRTATLDALAEGARIGVPNDTTNEARALQLLEAQGLLTLREGAGLEATVLDLVDNPKQLEIVELAAEQLTQVLEDLDLAVINGNYALSAGLDATRSLASEDADSEAATRFGNVIAVRSGDEERPELRALAEVLTGPEIAAFIRERYPNAVLPLN